MDKVHTNKKGQSYLFETFFRLTENPISYIKTFICLILSVINFQAIAQSQPAQLEASLLVIDQGPEIYSACGHAAVRMQSPIHGLDMCFSYLVDEGDSPILSTLYKGNKQGLVAIPMGEYVTRLEAEGRGFNEYTLNLSHQEKQELWRKLDEEWEKGMYIDYDFIRGGCALRLNNASSEIWSDGLISISCN